MESPNKKLRVAFVHEWLLTYAGAERVLEEMLTFFPDADVFTLFYAPNEKGLHFLKNHRVYSSPLNKIPFVRKFYRALLPIMPTFIEEFDFSNYDLVISSSHCVAKGVIVPMEAKHICMCYSPTRFVWDLKDHYSGSSSGFGISKFIKGLLLSRFRMWDFIASQRVDYFIAISKFIQHRINKFYRSGSYIVYPPVNVERFSQVNRNSKQEYYLTFGRLVPYKKVDLIVQAFRRFTDKKLVVIGDGPEFSRISANCPANVQMLGFQDQNVILEYLAGAKGFIFAAKEDFGIAPIEAQAAGVPVIAFAGGAAAETIETGSRRSGILFEEQSVRSITEAIMQFESGEYEITPQNCLENAKRFSTQSFREQFTNALKECGCEIVE